LPPPDKTRFPCSKKAEPLCKPSACFFGFCLAFFDVLFLQYLWRTERADFLLYPKGHDPGNIKAKNLDSLFAEQPGRAVCYYLELSIGRLLFLFFDEEL